MNTQVNAKLADEIISDLSKFRRVDSHMRGDLHMILGSKKALYVENNVMNAKLKMVLDQWEKWAVDAEATAGRIGANHSMHNELIRDAAQYRGCAYSVRAALGEGTE